MLVLAFIFIYVVFGIGVGRAVDDNPQVEDLILSAIMWPAYLIVLAVKGNK